jgi:cell division protein FtsI/penicillin-binding protein 2
MSEKNANKRIRLLAVFCVVIMAVFVVRLFYLQIIEFNKYHKLAYDEQVKRLDIPASRGEIYMMDGSQPVQVVLNKTVYTMFVDPSVVTQAEKVRQAIRDVAGGNAVDNFSQLIDQKDTRYAVVAKGLTRTQAQLIKDRHLSGVGFQAQSQRDYPEKTLAAQTLGFVNADGLGQYGVEGKFDQQLKGKDGLLQSVTDVSNVPLTIGSNNVDIPPQNGVNLVLTLDRNIQSYTEQALYKGLKDFGADHGSAVVMDPNTGKVLAMVSLPTFDPGNFSHVKDASVFNNGVITSPYEPGSVMKTFTMSTGIDTHTVTANSTYNNTDYIKVDDRVIENASKGQTGVITLQHAVNWSLNTGMVTVAQRLGGGSINEKARSIMYRYLHDKFRLGEMTGIEVAGEEKGIIIPPTDAEGNAVRYSNMSFGQGMELTMLQVASGFSAMMNGGTYYQPTVISGKVTDDGRYVAASPKKPTSGIISPSTSAQVRNMVVTARNAFGSVGDKPGYVIGGKTGTSQTIVNGSYDNGQTIGTYLGFGGDTKPRYVIMVQVSGKGKNLAGGANARPIFTNISNWMIDYLKLQPRR